MNIGTFTKLQTQRYFYRDKAGINVFLKKISYRFAP